MRTFGEVAGEEEVYYLRVCNLHTTFPIRLFLETPIYQGFVPLSCRQQISASNTVVFSSPDGHIRNELHYNMETVQNSVGKILKTEYVDIRSMRSILRELFKVNHLDK